VPKNLAGWQSKIKNFIFLSILSFLKRLKEKMPAIPCHSLPN
jgi:hypothetical protein